MTLRILPQNLINQIAAGEVVERPASAIKELVENAIDAGATQITVELKDGGKEYISVTDNGCGMTKDELPLAIERHATSKLAEGDLMAIQTMGFRGEALPSLGAVSRMTLTSKTESADIAWRLKIEGGDKQDLEPASLNVGTRIEIQDLFFATPARLKFMKSNATELNHARDLLERLAMARPHIGFRLKNNDKELFDYAACEGDAQIAYQMRLKQILGKEFFDNTIWVDAEREDYHIQGYVGLPTYSRSNASKQFFFINGRHVKDKVLFSAIKGAYHDLIAHDRAPVVVLYLTIPMREVDVNVHPAKTEVRFIDPSLLRSFIVSSIKHALVDRGQFTAPSLSDQAMDMFKMPERQRSYQAPLSTGRGQQIEETPLGFSQPSYSAQPAPVVTFTNPAPSSEEYKLGRAQAQLYKTFILSETKDSVILVDQHAAHERLEYEKFKNLLAAQGIRKQTLLIPQMVEVTAVEIALIKQHLDAFARLALVLEIYGDTTIVIREVPGVLAKANTEELLKDILDQLREEGNDLSLENKILEIFATRACHGSVRAGQTLSIDEMNALLREMEQTIHSSQCNHGRPTYVELKKKDIERLFSRS
jgi:DNA mismatch repair protein MutL